MGYKRLSSGYTKAAVHGMNDGCIIRTERLLLREIGENDTGVIVEWRADPLVYRYFKNPYALTIDEHTEWYRYKYMEDQDLISWIAFNNECPVGLFHIKKKNEDIGEVSYLVAPNHQKKGYASEALKKIEQWMSGYWGLSVAMAVIHRENISSIRFIESLGYCFYEANGIFYSYRKKIGNMIKETCLE